METSVAEHKLKYQINQLKASFVFCIFSFQVNFRQVKPNLTDFYKCLLRFCFSYYLELLLNSLVSTLNSVNDGSFLYDNFTSLATLSGDSNLIS